LDGGGKTIDNYDGLQPAGRENEHETLFESSVFTRRLLRLSSRCEIVCDSLTEDGIEIRCLRWSPSQEDASASFSLASDTRGFLSDDRMGALITGGPDGTTPVLWLPRGLIAGRTDRHGRLDAVEDGAAESWWELENSPKLHLRATGAPTVYVPMVAFGEGVSVTRADLFELEGIELRRFLKSDWFDVSSPADLWSYFVDASVFDPRNAGPGRFRCQQCAYAWWAYLMALHRHTGKRHYRSLASAVAWSVCIDLREDGSWRHGFWHEEPEIHSRMFWDGIRILIAEHEVAPHDQLIAAADAAAAFAVQHLTEKLDGDGLWFLHDSLEGAKPLRVQDAVAGRSQENTLCLNTHIQALAVLAQMRRVTGDEGRFSGEYARGLSALQAVLGIDCGGGPLRRIDRNLPRLLSWKTPRGFSERVLRFAAYRLLGSAYWWARKRSPCLVFPSGYMDRDLGRTMLADEYHVVNLKDLVELHRLDPQPWMEGLIVAGLQFVASLDLERSLQRHPIWAEWADVLEITTIEHGFDPEQVEATIVDVLGGRPLDAFCARSGVWRFEETD
jgi:hypothetical protein